MELNSVIDRVLPATVELRRRLHRIPELGYQEVKTAAAIRAELDRLGIKFVEGVKDAPTATIAWIGDVNKPCVALRADIDALPITEQTGLPHASTHAGRMHACGHDGHISTLMGTASVLKSIERDLSVCVKFLWQPAEEGGGGAEKLCDAGALDGRIGPKVSAIFGLHGWPGLPVGFISTKPGALMAATDTFDATFIGRGGHAAFPHLGHDPLVTAAEAVINLQQFVSREMDPTEAAVVTVAQFNAGTANNVIPDRATIAGTARTLTEPHRERIERSLRRRCEAIAMANECKIEFNWQRGYPPTVNNLAMTEYVAKIARQSLGSDRFIPAARPVMGGEDFSYYLEKVPGCFFFVGVMPEGRKEYPQLHTDRFDFTDAALGVGMRMFTELVMNFQVR
ncbi:M20 family metallopeptidase [soil metagenome]